MPKLAPFLAVLVALAPATALAKTFTLGTDPKVATITLPDAWDGDGADGQLEALSPDKTIFLSATAVDAADVKAAGQEVAKALAENKIELKQDTRKVAPVTVAGMSGAAISWDATDVGWRDAGASGHAQDSRPAERWSCCAGATRTPRRTTPPRSTASTKSLAPVK